MKNYILLCILIFSVLSIFLANSTDGFIAIKKYKVINSPKVCGDKLCSEIDEVKAKKGESSRNIKVCGEKICNEIKLKIGKKPTYQNSPIMQFKQGIALDLIQCKPHLELVKKVSNNSPACVTSKNIQKLIENGWALPIDSKNITEESTESMPRMDLEGNSMLSEASLTVTQKEINGKQFLIFYGFGWRGFHNVEITISDNEGVIDSIRTKTSEKGDLFMPWSVSDSVVSGMYSIYATDQIHNFEINIPITSLQK